MVVKLNIRMEKEFRIGDIVTVGVRNQKGRVVDKYKPCGTYSIYKIHLFIDGTYITAAKHELVKGMNGSEFKNIIPVTVASSTTLPQSNSIHDQSYCTSTSLKSVPDITDILSTPPHPPPPIDS